MRTVRRWAKQALRTVWRLPRVQACTMLGLGFTSYAPHGHFWSSALYGNTLWYHKSQLLPKSTFQGMSNSLWLWVGPRSWLAKCLMVQGSQILCNNGRYESLTTSIAEVFITWTSKSSLTSWRCHLDRAVFRWGVVVTSLLGCGFVHFYLTIRYDSHRRGLSRRWEKDIAFCHWLVQASCHSRVILKS